MPKVKIDNIEYEFDTLPEEAKKLVQSLQFVEAEIAQLSARVAAMQTARTAYYNALKQAIASAPTPASFGGDIIKLG